LDSTELSVTLSFVVYKREANPHVNRIKNQEESIKFMNVVQLHSGRIIYTRVLPTNTYLVVLDTCSKKEYVSDCSGHLFENECNNNNAASACPGGVQHDITYWSVRP
jgi:hypothetical protein